MKVSKRLLTLVMSVAIIFSGCSHKEDELTVESQVKIEVSGNDINRPENSSEGSLQPQYDTSKYISDNIDMKTVEEALTPVLGDMFAWEEYQFNYNILSEDEHEVVEAQNIANAVIDKWKVDNNKTDAELSKEDLFFIQDLHAQVYVSSLTIDKLVEYEKRKIFRNSTVLLPKLDWEITETLSVLDGLKDFGSPIESSDKWIYIHTSKLIKVTVYGDSDGKYVSMVDISYEKTIYETEYVQIIDDILKLLLTHFTDVYDETMLDVIIAQDKLEYINEDAGDRLIHFEDEKNNICLEIYQGARPHTRITPYAMWLQSNDGVESLLK